MSLPDSKICERCGAMFPRLDSYQHTQWKRRTYCSRSCAASATAEARAREMVPCPGCGERLVRPTTELCNRCRTKALRDAGDPRTLETERRAKAAFATRHPDYWKQPHFREQARIRGKQYRKDNPDKVQALVRRGKVARRAREANAAQDPPEIIGPWADVLRRDPCAYCGGPGGSADHIDAFARGGDHVVENLTGACRRCNSAKNATPLLFFLLFRSPPAWAKEAA